MAQIDKVNLNGVTYGIEPVMDRTVTEGSQLPVTSNAVAEFVEGMLEYLEGIKQTKNLSEPVNIGEYVVTGVVLALQRLAGNYTANAVEGSLQLFTSGGAFADKSDVPVANSKKNFTSGGAFADKSDVPVENSTKNFTSGGAFADRSDVTSQQPDSRCFTLLGAWRDKSNVPSADFHCFTAGGAYDFFAHSTNALTWLKKVFGSDYETKLANDYFVD